MTGQTPQACRREVHVAFAALPECAEKLVIGTQRSGPSDTRPRIDQGLPRRQLQTLRSACSKDVREVCQFDFAKVKNYGPIATKATDHEMRGADWHRGGERGGGGAKRCVACGIGERRGTAVGRCKATGFAVTDNITISLYQRQSDPERKVTAVARAAAAVCHGTCQETRSPTLAPAPAASPAPEPSGRSLRDAATPAPWLRPRSLCVGTR